MKYRVDLKDGKYYVTKDGAKRASKSFATHKEAINWSVDRGDFQAVYWYEDGVYMDIHLTTPSE